MKIQKKRNTGISRRPRFAAAALVGLMFWIGVFIYFYQEEGKSSGDSSSTLSRISGLQPETLVKYQLKAGDNIVVSGTEAADKKGRVFVPSTGRTPDGQFFYELEINPGKDPVRIYFSRDNQTGAIKISGQGLKEFSDITLERGEEKISTKADWAGIVRELESAGLGKPKGQSNTLKLALYGQNIFGEIEEDNALNIEVLLAPQGGSPEDDKINQYENEQCGDPKLSVCNDDKMKKQLVNIVKNYVTALQMMTEQFTAVMMQQILIAGTFFDAKHQMDTQRVIQELRAEAHKDYHPSEQMCRFGSYINSLARAEERIKIDQQGINKALMDTYTAPPNMATSGGYPGDIKSRLERFRTVYCDLQDNNAGLQAMCDHDQLAPTDGSGGSDPARLNRDIDYPGLVAFPLTLDINFSDDTDSADEQDIVALAKNLYWPENFILPLPEDVPDKRDAYMDARHIFAVNNVAHNSLATIAGMKGKSPPGSEESGWRFMKAFMRDFGMDDTEINRVLGEYPSYYAQMEVLTKKIYQSPNFYTDLYDKPANVARIGAAMEAIKLMQMRDFYEANLRREMLTSLLVTDGLNIEMEKIDLDIGNAIVSGKFNNRTSETP